MPESCLVVAPAKFNISLAVGPVRGDGFHPVATCYCAVGLTDEVTAEAREPGLFEVRVEGSGDAADVTSVPLDDSNIAVKAARAVAKASGRDDCPGVSMTITKRIPVAAGLAGGSADAAAALVACNDVMDAKLSNATLRELAAELGSDVPFSLMGGVAVGTGRGEQLDAVDTTENSLHLVIAASLFELSTAAVYGEFDRLVDAGDIPAAEPRVAPELLDALRAGDVDTMATHMHNDLEAPALSLEPALADVLAAMDKAGAVRSMVSGSGPSVVGLARSAADAQDIAARLAGTPHVRDIVVASAPTAGAHVA